MKFIKNKMKKGSGLRKILPLFLLLSLMMQACGGEDEVAEPFSGVVRNSAVPFTGVVRRQPEPDAEPMSQVICIDPGHGFDDGGTSSEYLNGLNEDDINLAIALYLDEALRGLGYSTVLTHDGKTFPITSAYDNNNKYRPEERTAFANSIDIDYYVSIHCNSHTDPTAYGIRTYYYTGYTDAGVTAGEIAEAIHGGILDTLEEGTRSTLIDMTSGVYHVLRATNVPASLIEVGFVTNESDAAKMIDEAWQKSLAEGIAAGIDNYYRGTSAETSQPQPQF